MDEFAAQPCGTMEHLCAELLFLPSETSIDAGMGNARTGTRQQDVQESIAGTEVLQCPAAEENGSPLIGASTAKQGPSLGETCRESFSETLGEVIASISVVTPGSPAGVLVEEGGHYLCQKCGESFPYPSLLSPHQCALFTQSDSLDFHEASHLSLTAQLVETDMPSQETERPRTRLGFHLAKAQSSTEHSGPGMTPDPVDYEKVQCPICSQEFTRLIQLKSHFKCHTQPRQSFACSAGDCRYTTEERKLFRTHLRRVHKVTPVTCAHQACQLLFRSADDMLQHRRSHFPFHCRYCSIVSSNVRLFSQHQKSHMEEAEPPTPTPTSSVGLKELCGCSKCDFTTVSVKVLNQHLRLHSDCDISQEEQNSQEDGDEGEDVSSSASDLPRQHQSESVWEGGSESSDDHATSSSDEEEAEEHAESTRDVGETKKATPAAPPAPQVPQLKGVVAQGTEYLFKTHMCPECKRCFKKRTHLVEHLHIHFPDPSLQCPNCQRFFTSRSKLKIHMMREQGEKSHHCPLCDYSAVEKNALNRHMSSMHEDSSNFYSDTYPCPACKEKFSLSQALKEHMKSHKAEPQLLVCFQEGCEKATADRKEFLFHLKDAHAIKPVECRHHACSLLFPSREEMEAHQLSHYAFHCDQCSFFCSNKLAFRRHKRQGHPGSEELVCRFCPFKTFNPVEFRDHVGKMHANEKIHNCDECDFATAHKRVLSRHKMLHTGEKPYKCQSCEFTCRDVSYLSKHMLTHSTDKNYMCTECGYITKWKHYLSVHMRKHTGDLRYHCNQCSYRCHRADQLSSHKLRHQGKSLICEVCGFACKRKYELQKHRQARHSQNYQMPVYHCQYCRYQSNYKQALRNHENCKHTKQKEFRCALCPYRTFSSTSLFCHKRKIHGYVPGDKKWLENYASKEMEICSEDGLLNYDLTATRKLEATLPPHRRDLWQRAQPATVETQHNDYPQINGAPCPGSEQPQQIVEAVRSLEGVEPNDTMEGGPADFFAQMPSMAATPELTDLALESVVSCSLQLESMGTQGHPSISAEQLSEDPSALPLDDLETLNCEEPATVCPDLDTGETLVLEENPPVEGLRYSDLSNGPDTEECIDLEKVVDCSAEDIVMDAQEQSMECAIQTFTEEQPSANRTSSSEADPCAGDEHIDIQETLTDALKPGELLTLDLTVCDSHAPVENHLSTADTAAFLEETEASSSESVLKALRRQDKEQAETLLLEGRVQMLVLQSDTQVFTCGKCSYITRKEKSMSLHKEAGCGTRKSLLLCKECGASFQQQRGLNTHIMKKCPVIQKRSKIRPAFYVELGRCPTTRQSALQTVKNPSDDNGAGTACSSHNPNLVGTVSAENCEDHQEAASKTPADLCVPQEVVGEVPQEVVERLAEALFRDAQPDHGCVAGDQCPSPPKSEEKYTFHQGKFHCKRCSFVCSRFSTITGHVEEGCKRLEQFPCRLCAESFRSKRALKAHQEEKHLKLEPEESVLEEGSEVESSKDEGSGDEDQDGDTASQEDDGPDTHELRRKRHSKKDTSLKDRCVSCPVCPFTCYQERAMETHKKKGCLESEEFQCASCSLQCSSSQELLHHMQLHKKLYSKRPQLRCRQCDFTCKQARCLKQHVRIQHEGVKPHKCAYCDFSTTRRYRLEAHESLHTGLGRISCDVCSQTFGTNSKLRIHTLRVHEKKPTHFCSLCDYGGYNQNDINRHINSCHNGELRFACTQCEARFSSETALKQHSLRKHEDKICLSCQHCLFVCHSDTTLKCHMQKQHPHLECGTCKEVFDSRDVLEDHKKSHFSHRCECCDFAAKERLQLVNHYLEVHEPTAAAEPGLRCPFCDFACQYQLVLDHHVKGHGGTRAYKCSDCDYTTKNKQKITWHIRIHTGEKPYKCHLCIYACGDPSRLKYHMRIHKDERKYLCPDCGYKCKWVNQLKYHMTKHTGHKPYACDECDYCSNRADALRIHKETRHRDARSFICEQCGKAFKTRFLLKTHQKKHSEDKPYVCNVCHRGFRWAAGLRHHYLTHTNEHPFFCRYCSYTAKQKFQVIKHIRRHHPENTSTDPKDGVGKDPSTPTVHLHDVQLESVEEMPATLLAPAEALG